MRWYACSLFIMLTMTSGCAATMTRAQLDNVKGRGKIAGIVAPVRLTLHNVAGIGGGEEELGQVYGGKPPWRGDRFVGVIYDMAVAQSGGALFQKAIIAPVGTDVRAIAGRQMATVARKTLGVDLVMDGGPVLNRLGHETYMFLVSHNPIELGSDRTLGAEDWKKLAAEGISAVVVYGILSVAITGSSRVGVFVRVLVIDTATGEIVHEGKQIHNGEVPWEKLSAFFPKIETATTIFGIKEMVPAYDKAVTRDPARIEWLGDQIASHLAAALEAELVRIK